MRIAVVGLPFFADRLANELGKSVIEHTFHYFNTYYSRIDRIKYALYLPFADIVISMNGVSDKSGSMELACLLGKKILFQWQGTDVMLAVKRYHDGSIYNKYIRHGRHITVAPWLTNELDSIGIDAPAIDFKWIDPIQKLSENYSNNAVYTYLAKGREDFYGWPLILKLAIKYPEIKFHIAGSDGNNLNYPDNIHFLGWLTKEQMAALRINTPIYLRLTEHDGFSNAVLEALSAGNEVIWTYPGSHCHHVNTENIEDVFEALVAKLNSNGLQRNQDNINFINQQYNREVIINTLLQEIQKTFE